MDPLLILIIILLVVFFVAMPVYPHSANWGWSAPSIILVVLLMLVLLRYL